MKLLSWNVNGLRACMKKGFLEFYQAQSPDFLCLQETKMERGQADVPLGEGILEYWNSAEKKGYSGTAVFTPVSYTHLDVYKRQAGGRPAPCHKIRSGRWWYAGPCRPGPTPWWVRYREAAATSCT